MAVVRKKESVERIDANILIHLITKDNPETVKKIEKLFSRKGKFYVFDDPAMMEVIFVLSGNRYRFGREQIKRNIKKIMLIPNLICNRPIIESALDFYTSHPKLSFTDCYLAVSAEASGETPLWTLDQKLTYQCPAAREL